MTTVIKRNDVLESILKYWNHNDHSNIGIGRLSRKINSEGVYLINKNEGRQDLALFNVKTAITINGEVIAQQGNNVQLSLEPYGISRSRALDYGVIRPYIVKWVESNKEELCIQLHFLNWFNKVEIKDLTVGKTIEILNSYSYNQEEAESLFNELDY